MIAVVAGIIEGGGSVLLDTSLSGQSEAISHNRG